jgi:Spy/CpxP family protein refolding chaperone
MVVLLTAGMATAAVAQGPGCGAGDGSGRGGRDAPDGPQMRIERMTRHLGLSEEQVTAISDLQTKGRAANLELRKDMMRLQNEKRGEMLKDEPSEKKVVELTRKIGDLRTTMQANRVSGRLAVRKLLTPEQRDKMLTMDTQMGGRRGEHRGRGGKDCGGPRGKCGHDGRGGR